MAEDWCKSMESNQQKSFSCPILSREACLQQRYELQILYDISSALHGSPHLQDVLQKALMAILSNLEFKMGAIYLLKEVQADQLLLELAAHHGVSYTLANSIKFLSAPRKLIEGYYFKNPVRWLPIGKIVFSRLRDRMREEGIEEIISISLMTQKKVLGLLYVTNDGPLQLKPDRSELLTTIGQQLGVSIENAQLFESVERAKSELEISLDAIQHSIFLVDTRMRIYRVNRTSEMVYGDSKELIGKKYTNILYNMEQPHPECAIWACLWSGQPVRREGPHPRWGGYYHFYAFPVFNPTGTLERVVYYEKDATEARKLEQRLQQSDRLKALGTLAAGIAHEIRNPLATINFNAQMLLRELSLDPAQEQMFDDMVQEIKKIDRIVQQVLLFARPREPQFLPNQLNDVVRYCHDLAKVHLRKANVEVSLELEKDIPTLVMDFSQISQVVMNLILNAIEAMTGGGKLTIKTEYQKAPAALVLELSDTGPGILEEDRNRIFDPFFTRKPEGTGLGLSISRQILEKHGAYIELDSTPGEGTTFRIVFPLPSGESGALPVQTTVT